MMTACYVAGVDGQQRTRLLAAQQAIVDAKHERVEAIAARRELIQDLYKSDVTVASITRALGVRRDTVQLAIRPIVKPWPRPVGRNSNEKEAAQLRDAQDRVESAERRLGVRNDSSPLPAGLAPTVYDERNDVHIALYAEGVGVSEQAAALGMHRQTVQNVIDEYRRRQRRDN